MDKDTNLRRITVNVRFPKKTLKRLERRAKQERRTKSEIVSEAIDKLRKSWLLPIAIVAGALLWWMVASDDDGDGVPDCIENVLGFPHGIIEKWFGLADGEIEKRLWLNGNSNYDT